MATTTNHVESEEAQQTRILQEIENEEREEQKAARAAAVALKIERHGLKKRFEKETGGVEGKKFLILETIAGLFVIVKKEPVLYKALIKGEQTDEELEKFLELSTAYPDKDKAKAAIADYPAIVRMIINKAVTLYGLEDVTKK